jgi:hypothetical protein
MISTCLPSRRRRGEWGVGTLYIPIEQKGRGGGDSNRITSLKILSTRPLIHVRVHPPEDLLLNNPIFLAKFRSVNKYINIHRTFM